LIGDEFVEIDVCEHAPPTALAVAKGDVFQRARSNVAVQRFDRAAELGSSLRGSLEPVRGREVRLAGGTFLPLERKPSAICPQTFRTVTVLAAKSHERRGHACGSRRIFL
jgi:hypothetical protein